MQRKNRVMQQRRQRKNRLIGNKRPRSKAKVLRKRSTPSAEAVTAAWREAAGHAGRVALIEGLPEVESGRLKFINEQWCRFYLDGGNRIPAYAYQEASRLFLESYCARAGIPLLDGVLIPTRKTVTAIVTAMNEEEIILSVLNELCRLPLKEILVIVNGSKDRTFEIIKKHGRAVVVHYTQALGYDVGRSIGAKLTETDVLLFVDGDFLIKAEELVPFIRAIANGADIALNDITPFIGTFAHWDAVTVMKAFLNRSLGRRDLGTSSLTAVPHAISRWALEVIGYRQLLVPPKAQALAVHRGLSVVKAGSVDVVRTNKVRDQNTGLHNPVSALILGDHMEALHTVMSEAGSRMRYPDHMRVRRAIQGGTG